MSRTIVIVGAGFCGTVLAVKLLRRPPAEPTDIILIDRGTSHGRGLAYAAHDVPYLLNVPAGRLSMDAQDPGEFLRYVRQFHPDADAEDFLPRAMYGDYLQEALDRASQQAPSHVKFSTLFGEVTNVVATTPYAATDGVLNVLFTDRPPVLAQQVVLALGNPPPPMQPWARGLEKHRAYIHNPWAMPRRFDAGHSVLVVGNGLTMVDVVLSLSLESGAVPQLRTISRRGLVPLAQTIFSPKAVQGNGEFLLSNAQSVRRVLRASRELTRDVESLGGDWREVVTYIRNLAPRLWHLMPAAEQRRFVRHLQAYWDIHRHRLPPRMSARIEHMRRSGRLEVNAGRIEQLVPEGGQLRVMWKRRGSREMRSFAADAVINATGPDYSLQRSRDPLLRSLRDAGIVSADPLGLGLRTAANLAVVAADGAAHQQLFYLGPMLRANHWEATAATELRDHAERLSMHLISSDMPA